MSPLDTISSYTDELSAIFEDLHAHPELGFEESRTSGIVAAKLREIGVDEVREGLGGTGVVGVIRGKAPGRQIGLRADMDALPIDEQTNLGYASQTAGTMHACGHDGHTTMLLGAARYLATTRDFAGTVVLIFQPAEEGLGGARKMLADGLLKEFPCEELYGMHNSPMLPPGEVRICKGTAMAGAEFFDITVRGRGSHAAMPHDAKDPIVIASSLVGQIQSIVSRNVPAIDACVVSVTQIHAGAAYNVVPGDATLAGTIRYFKDEVRDLAVDRMKTLAAGLATAFDVEIEVDVRNVFDVLENDADLSDAYLAAAADVVGPESVGEVQPLLGSEDFADMLKAAPGAYCVVGHSGDMPLHNPGFVLGQEILPTGAAILARIVENRLSA